MTKDERLLLLGNRVRQIRLKLQLTQQELGDRVGKDQQSIQRLESGKVNPSFEYLYEISIGLEIKLKDLIDIDSDGKYDIK